MPRILVADDNSNIQKMVTLALKDVGIDVVAVPNGEAAVRKLTDSSLDLVLADIFMPVRSGYEVCEFIKQDPRYSHLPVVLLVGAFDPLDEREAQRVGADGILKKPFVPPDPLINMVKGLLAKVASERLVAVSASAESAASTAEAAPPPLPKRAPEPPREFPTADFSDVAPEEFVPPVGRLEFEETEHPVAFDSLLDTATADDRDLTVTASRDPVLGEPAFWAHPGTDETGTEPEETDDGDVLQDHNWGAHAQPLPFGIETPTLPLPTHETARQASTLDSAVETASEALPAINLAASPADNSSDNFDLPSETASDAGPSLIIEAITESGSSAILPSVHFPPIEPEAEPTIDAKTESKTETEPEIAHTLNLAIEPAIEAMQAVESKVEHANLLEMPSVATADNAAVSHETAAAPPKPDVEHFFPDLAAISAELEAMSTVKHAPAPQESPEAHEPAYLSDTTIEAKHSLKVFETPEIEEPEPVETAPVQPANEATIDTQKVVIDRISADTLNAEVPGASATSDDKSSTTNGEAHLDPVPSLAEMPGWMASVSSIFPPMESSLEAAAKAELDALSREHGAIPETLLGEKLDTASHTEQVDREESAAHVAPDAETESSEVSEPNLLTTAWPPPFEPKVSDAELFERPTLPSRIFEIPLEAADIARASAPRLSEPVREPAPVAAASASLAAVPQTGNGALQTPEMVEAIVSRIVERMQPQVIDVVTREILRPLVEALVRREIDKH